MFEFLKHINVNHATYQNSKNIINNLAKVKIHSE